MNLTLRVKSAPSIKLRYVPGLKGDKGDTGDVTPEAEAARDEAEAAAAAAAVSQSVAAGSALSASTSATNAANSATAAENSAEAAGNAEATTTALAGYLTTQAAIATTAAADAQAAEAQVGVLAAGVTAAAALFPAGNRIINGSCRVAQRGNGNSTTAGTIFYGGCDRFYGLATGGTSLTLDLQQGSGATDVASGYTQSLTFTKTTGTNVQIGQRVEAANCLDLPNGKVAVQARVFHNLGLAANVTLTLAYATAADNFASVTTIDSATTSVATGTWTLIWFVVNSMPANARNGLQLSASLACGTATSKVFQVGDMSLRPGDMSPFDPRPFPLELSLCQRYYEKVGFGQGTAPAEGVTLAEYLGAALSTTSIRVMLRFAVVKRTTPTVTLYRGATGYTAPTAKWAYFLPGTGFIDPSAQTVPEIRDDGIHTQLTGTFTAGSTYLVEGGLAASAEL